MPQPTTIDHRERRWAMFLSAIAVVSLPSVILLVNNDPGSPEKSDRVWNWIGFIAALFVGPGLAFLLHPYRSRGLVPLGASIWCVVALVCAANNNYPGWALGLIMGITSAGLNRFPRTSRIPGEGIMYLGAILLGVAAVIGWMQLPNSLMWGGYFVACIAGILAVTAWLCLFRPTFELLAEPVLGIMYSIRGVGPGLRSMPAEGPCLVLANHACWFDPLFLAKVLPRRITPLMTARFYNLPLIHWFMRRFGVIRVNEKAIRREMPEELVEAIAALDRGECVLIFPESYLRRTEERELRRFARGIWQILAARPNTPVFCCWLDGTWGSYTSYCNGPPTKNKKMDFRRRIRIGISDALFISDELLEEHLKTRMMLMNEVSRARTLLGLPELSRFELPEDDAQPASQS